MLIARCHWWRHQKRIVNAAVSETASGSRRQPGEEGVCGHAVIPATRYRYRSIDTDVSGRRGWQEAAVARHRRQCSRPSRHLGQTPRFLRAPAAVMAATAIPPCHQQAMKLFTQANSHAKDVDVRNFAQARMTE
jgi:hypothetical protein